MTPERLTEFSIYLAQRPGELAGLLEACAVAGVNLEAISVVEHNDKGCVRLVGSPADGLRRVCEGLVESGIGPVVEATVLAIETEHRPGAVRDAAEVFAKAGVNVRYVYLATNANGGPSRCVFRLDDLERGLTALEGVDWPQQNGLEGDQAEGSAA